MNGRKGARRDDGRRPQEDQPAQGQADLPLGEQEATQVEERAAISPLVVHEVIRNLGEEDLERPVSALAWSGLAAGLSMGFSLVAEGLLRNHLPDAPSSRSSGTASAS